MTKNQIALANKIEKRIVIVRGQRVMLDSDLAELYGVNLKVLNQAVKRNAGRFPDDFSYLITLHEFKNLKSQFVTSSYGGKRKPPRVFTEQGVAMLSSVLNSPLAIKVNIEIMRVFVQLRRLLATPGEIVEQLQKLSDTVQLHDHQIKKIADVLQQMMTVPSQPPREMGFHTLRKKTRGSQSSGGKQSCGMLAIPPFKFMLQEETITSKISLGTFAHSGELRCLKNSSLIPRCSSS